MQSVYNYVVEPLGERYNNTKKVEDKELIVNIAPQYEDKDRFGFGIDQQTNKHLPTYKDK